MIQRSVMDIVPPFLLKLSFVRAAEVCKGTFALCLCSFSNDLIPVTLQCYCEHEIPWTYLTMQIALRDSFCHPNHLPLRC